MSFVADVDQGPSGAEPGPPSKTLRPMDLQDRGPRPAGGASGIRIAYKP